MFIARSGIALPRRTAFQSQLAPASRVSGPIKPITGPVVGAPHHARSPSADSAPAARSLVAAAAAAPGGPDSAAATTAAAAAPTANKMEVATVGGGCFWCVEACYNMMKGVQSAISGYAAGHVKDPTYKQVCAGTTGHAEVVQITYDPSIVSYKEILEIFFTIHDPTTKDRQGNDVGTQYRSIILTHNDQQAQTAKEVMQQVSSEGWWSAPLVTQVEPLGIFYPAEEYHQNYFVQNPGQGYCRAVVGPKVAKFRSKFAAKLKQ